MAALRTNAFWTRFRGLVRTHFIVGRESEARTLRAFRGASVTPEVYLAGSHFAGSSGAISTGSASLACPAERHAA